MTDIPTGRAEATMPQVPDVVAVFGRAGAGEYGQRMGVGRFGNRPAAASDPVLGRHTDLQQLEWPAAAVKPHPEALQACMESLKAQVNE